MRLAMRPFRAPAASAHGNVQTGRAHDASKSRAPQPATAANAVPNGAALRETPGMRARFRQLIHTREVPYPPALKYEGDWRAASAAICSDWISDQAHRRRLLASEAAAREISYLLALAYERDHLKALRQSNPEDLLLPDVDNPNQEYADAIVRAFLRAVGEADVDAVLESFKHAGTGALHRQHVTAGATVTHGLAAAQVLVPDPLAKLALSGVRLLSQLGTSAAVAASGKRRLRNAGTEDVLPRGRAEAAAAARTAPNVLQASWSALWKLRSAEKDMRRLDAALQRLSILRSVARADDPSHGICAADAARNDLDLAFARICHKLVVKSRYKAASENAKVEWRGNERNLYSGTSGTLATLLAGGIAILTPEFIAAAVSGGLLAGAATTALLLYVGYQLSNGPSKDGEAKARRAIIALSKLAEVLDPAQDEAIRRRAGAYERYLHHRRTTWRVKPAARRAAREDARQALFAALRGIAEDERNKQEAGPPAGVSAQENCRAFYAYRRRKREIEDAPTCSDEERRAALQALDRRFHEEHAGKLTVKPLIDGWKPQVQIKMETARRLLTGKVARAQKQLIRLRDSAPSPSSHEHRRRPALRQALDDMHAPRRAKHRQKLEQTRSGLRQHLRDLVYFELALSRMNAGNDSRRPEPALSACAGEAFARIGDSDVHALFCGEAEQQVKATYHSKLLAEGEAKRYTLLNTGANALTMSLAPALQAADVHIAAAKATGAYDGPKVLDFKLLATQQAGATPSAPLSTGDRTPFQRREMRPLLKTIEPRSNMEAAHLEMTLPDVPFHAAEAANDAAQEFDRQLDRQIGLMIDTMAGRQFIPETLRLRFASPPGIDRIAAAGERRERVIEVNLAGTTAFHRVRYKKASAAQKVRYVTGEAAIAAKQTAAIYAGLPVQAAAQRSLKTSRAALHQAKDRVAGARDVLMQYGRQDAARQPPPRRPPSGMPATAESETAPPEPLHDGLAELIQLNNRLYQSLAR